MWKDAIDGVSKVLSLTRDVEDCEEEIRELVRSYVTCVENYVKRKTK
jgi:hypothetical protein